uniref:Gamma-glutamylcyclotransferase AIG2-like domain-containing protein n=1 Tax=Entomoneis paludosa TaxID=265537 RepID=A0A7S3DSQ5_9STRA
MVPNTNIGRTYLFGYGSLLCSKSRGITCPELSDRAAIPVMVNGLERTWSKRSAKLGMTAMGIRFREGSRCAGVLVPLASSKELELFDHREQGYQRHRLDLESIEKIDFLPEEKYEEHDEFIQVLAQTQEDNSSLEGSSDEDSVSSLNELDIWVYVPEKTMAPAKDFPIAQSYVDTILRGCMDVGGEPLVEEFLTTTTGWHPEDWEDPHYAKSDRIASVWINDRSDPVYTRGDPNHFRKHGRTFDKFLTEYISDYLPLRVDPQ